MGQAASTTADVCAYYRSMWLIVSTGGQYDYVHLRRLCGLGDEAAKGEETERLFSASYLHSIGLMIKLFHEGHYRTESLQQDLLDNLSNIVLPGTGAPLSFFCRHIMLLKLYFMVIHPVVVAVSAVKIGGSPAHSNGRNFAAIFGDELLRPGHWFALWRINSVLVAAHQHRHQNSPSVTKQYSMENKWEFLMAGRENAQTPGFEKLKMTPVIEDAVEIVCKHRNMEGGLGVHIFRNAVHEGDWIIQKRLYNAPEIQRLLPDSAPLSTFRVITMVDPRVRKGDPGRISVVTVVFRAGRAGKSTDHSSILLPIDLEAGCVVLPGAKVSNWFSKGEPFAPVLSQRGVTVHPDTKRDLTGEVLPSARSGADMCMAAHELLIPDVPIAGWDVAVTPCQGPVLLEANLSCNLFGGIYDRRAYAERIDAYYTSLRA